jgi:hypothetical protein
VNAVTELADSCQAAKRIAARFKQERRAWLRERVAEAGVADPDTLATQLSVLVDGAIATMLVQQDPSVARAARAAAEVLLVAGVSPTAARTAD